MGKDYYAILGIGKKADAKEIKSAYRKLARKFHPDVNPNDKSAETRFKEVSEAYEILGDPEKRKMYDQFGSNWEAASNIGGAQAGAGAEGMNFNFSTQGDIGAIFENLFGGFGRGAGRMEDLNAAQPTDLEKTVELPLEEIDTGTKRLLTYQAMNASRSAHGISQIPSTKKVEITIPKGIEDGKKLRVPGKGGGGANGRAGDLYVTVKWATHRLFKPAGDHLEVEVAVPFTVAALGGEIKVPTLRSAVTMKIPEGTQSGQTFRLGGQGISKMNGARGDLMAKVKVTVPKKLSDSQRSLIKQLAELEATV